MIREDCKNWTSCCDEDINCCYYEELDYCYDSCERYRKCEWCINCGDNCCPLTDEEVKQLGRW